MAKRRAKKKNQARIRSAAVAKRHRRADRKVKRDLPGVAIQQRGVDMLDAPVWQYPEIAASLVDSGSDPDDLAYADALDLLLSYPIYVSDGAQPPGAMLPLQQIEQDGLTPEDFIASMEELHRAGLLEWDALARVHTMIVPPTTDQDSRRAD